MSYTLRFSSRFERGLKKLHPKDAKRAIEQISKLQENPFPKGKKVRHLIGTAAWRLRTGKTRTIYFVDEDKKTIYVEETNYRKDVY